MLERISSFLDRFSSLPFWQLAVIAALALAAVVGGYFILRPLPRPAGTFHAVEEEEPEGSRMTVHVAGAVVHPGVVLLDRGARVLDALQQAGGPLPEADLDSLNLAQVVQDGQKIIVPRKGEVLPGAADSTGSGKGRVSINTAEQSELERLPGIGPTLAERIIAYRDRNGGFKSVEELKRVSGIGQKKFEEIRDLVEI